MSELFDDVTRVVAAPISRRQALKLIAGALGAVILNRFFGASKRAMAEDYCDWIIYTHPCADICCRDDYYCASTTLLNGADTYGICCYQTGTHLCSAGGYGWCCDNDKECGIERFTCGACVSGYETCGSACCNTGAGETCCDPDHSVCCTTGEECCFDASDAGTCCSGGTECVPVSATGWPPGHVCCPADQACIGQCCPPGELCFMNLACCPQDRITTDRTGCCPAGFLYFAPNDSCCLEGHYCGDVCCPAGKVCRDGTCQDCPGGQELCFDTCCASSTCCFGKCCGDGQTCTGECTTLETITATVNPVSGGLLTSTDGGVTITFTALGTADTVQYVSQAQPGHPLPENAQLLRSFTLSSPPAGARPQQVEYVYYKIRVRYAEATLAAMGVESKLQLQFLWWNAADLAWVPIMYAEIDRSVEEVIVTHALLGEFALAAGEKTQVGSETVYLPLVMK